MRKIKRDDLVLVIGGKERGKQGQVREVFPRQQRVVVQGLNMIKRHQRQRSERTPAGIIEKEAPIHVSNVKLICQACQKPARTGVRVRSDGVKVRVCKSCGQDID
jgi:large subunit ribosomal protein L24